MGQPSAFLLSLLACFLWAVSGPVFKYSDTWQLVINTATTVLTFLAVFLIQNTQNRDAAAVQAKLDEILIAIGRARTEMVGIENLTDDELTALKAALEHEALKSTARTADAAAKSDEAIPTVAEILENRDKDEVTKPPRKRARSTKAKAAKRT
jgi:low affinity Fe/Cu permease